MPIWGSTWLGIAERHFSKAVLLQVLFAVLVCDKLADAGFGLEFAQGVEHVAGAVEVFDEEELVGELQVFGRSRGHFR